MATVLPVSWVEILNNVEIALEQAKKNAAQLADGEVAEAKTASESALDETLQRLDANIRHLASCVAQAGEKAAETEALMQIGEETLRTWLAKAGAMRRKLEPAVGHSL